MAASDFQLFGDLIGALAATLTTSAFIPQAWHTWKTKHAKGISLGMYSIFTTGVALWLVYGLMIDAWPLIMSKGIKLHQKSSYLPSFGVSIFNRCCVSLYIRW